MIEKFLRNTPSADVSRLAESRTARLFGLCLAIVLSTRASFAEDVLPATASSKAIAEQLGPWIETLMADQGLPAISIALVDGDKIVWSRGFGLAKPSEHAQATADTIHRVGSVSKLFTDVAVMSLVEKGVLDLDAPVTKVLPDFEPKNFTSKPITLKHLMSHRSGLVREPPVGHYFDSSSPTLKETVASLNNTTLVYEPGAKTKYSNAGIAVVGRVLEAATGQPFDAAVKSLVLEKLGMDRSGFSLPDSLLRQEADGLMWTYDGRRFAAPTFKLGMAPAGDLQTTANDLGRFMICLFARGEGPKGRVLGAETLRTMWAPPFAEEGGKSTFGLGFAVSTLDGHMKVGHGGAVYGFATQFEALPDDKLGAVVITTLDCANNSAGKIANTALRLMLAAKRGKALAPPALSKPVTQAKIQMLAWPRWGEGEAAVDVFSANGKLHCLPVRGGQALEIRDLGDDLAVDDRLAEFPGLSIRGKNVLLDGQRLEGKALPSPMDIPSAWTGLIGEYGWDYDTLYILEKDSKLFALIEWFFYYPLKQISNDTYAFPDWGMYENEKLVFKRDSNGKAERAELAGVVFPRHKLPGDGAQSVRIKPIKPVDELRKQAIATHPPKEAGSFNEPELVELVKLDPTIKLDIRYATDNNFLGTPVYEEARAFMQKPAAEALLKVQGELKGKGLGLLIHDAYRPWHVTKIFWEATPQESRIFVADPQTGSKHNRGCAVDLTLYDLKTGKAVEMPGLYDEFSTRSYPDYPGGTSKQRHFRELLRSVMERQGFTVNEVEWWHFDYKDWPRYPIINKAFDEISGK